VFELKPKYQLGTIAAHGSVVVIGEVGHFLSLFKIYCQVQLLFFFFWQDRKVHLNEWDGKTLKETVVLEGNQNIVSALAFSPDGKLLASGDVNI
jgi:WD repeat-containing protein 1 (actin-interacting protein 1)